jgi:hypothetical protein
MDPDQRTAAKFIHFGFLQLLDSLNLLGTNSLPQSLPPGLCGAASQSQVIR